VEVFRYRNIYPSAIAAVAAGMISIKEIVTDTFKLDDTAKAMEYSV
jgi:L-iditol 2-dehydrogenase